MKTYMNFITYKNFDKIYYSLNNNFILSQKDDYIKKFIITQTICINHNLKGFIDNKIMPKIILKLIKKSDINIIEDSVVITSIIVLLDEIKKQNEFYIIDDFLTEHDKKKFYNEYTNFINEIINEDKLYLLTEMINKIKELDIYKRYRGFSSKFINLNMKQQEDLFARSTFYKNYDEYYKKRWENIFFSIILIKINKRKLKYSESEIFIFFKNFNIQTDIQDMNFFNAPRIVLLKKGIGSFLEFSIITIAIIIMILVFLMIIL